jgi:uncharacterized repeat protein (TIGR03803 family)
MQLYRSLRNLRGAFLFMTLLTLLLASGAVAQSKFTVVKTFRRSAGMNGYLPMDSLIVDQAGNLYGTTVFGGNTDSGCHIGCGVVFELTPNGGGGWTEKVLYSFAGGNDGANPTAGLIFDAAGNLYGTTMGGGGTGAGGTVFKLTPNKDGSWNESVLYSFCSFTNCTDGGSPNAGVILDHTGNLYGTTLFGGNSSPNCNGGNLNCGVVYKLTPKSGGGWTETVLYNFQGGSDGGFPYGGVIFDQSGNLYGSTSEGGGTSCSYGCGLIFKLTLQSNGSWTESVLHSFTGGSDGGVPNGGLVFGANGNLYGTTYIGGFLGKRFCPMGCGAVFELTPNGGTWTETVLHQFRGKDGNFPLAGLAFDAAGNLYGTTLFGGKDYGTVFKLTPNSSGWTETVLHDFENHPGAYPRASVVFDAAGNLYGTTYGDGSKTFGSVFEITP